MAIELGPVILDVETPIKEAAAKVPSASKPLEAAVEKETKRISSAIAKMQKASTKALDEGGVEALNKRMTTYAHTIELAAKNMMKYGQQQGKLTAGRLDIKALSSEITVLSNKWNALKLGSKFDPDGKLRVRAQDLIDRMSRLTAQTVKFGNALSASSAKASAATKGAAAGIEATNVALTKQGGILARLTGYLSTYTLLFAGLRFIRNIRETTAEFELQRVALGSIIKDAEQANLLFRQIKAAAIESPFQIKDLVTYTKQLSAYRVETENLFDVTMRLADVSAGLGVDMNRLILAYGQVRAAAVLRGQELRQFTEAGIPLVELLAEKFTLLNGRMTTTAEVFDLMRKRAIPFEMIAEIFNDMTNAGGMFYKMQEKQAETLAGQWSNLKDALSIMYDEIGNTDSVHNAMSSLIQDAKFLFQNWRVIAQILKTVAINYGLVKVASLFVPKLVKDTKLAAAAEAALARAQQLEAKQQVKQNALRAISIKQLQRYSAELNKAAVAQTALGRGWHKFAASMLGGGWIGLAATAASVLVGWLISAWKESRRLSNELKEIGVEGRASIDKSIFNFERLAKAAVNAADGSNEQNEALAELQRTYSDIIPSENLQIEKLKALEGNYKSLTEAIRQKISMQTKEQEINAVSDYFAGKIQKGKKKTSNLLSQYGLDKQQINAVLDEVQNMVNEGLIGIETSIGQRTVAVEDVIKKLTGITVDLGNGFRDYEGVWHDVRENNDKTRKSIENIVDTYIQLRQETRKIEDDMSGQIGSMGVYATAWDNLKKEIDKVTVSEEIFGDKQTFAYKKEKIRQEVELMAKAIEDAFKDTGIDISEAIQPDGKIDFKSINEAASKSEKWGIQSYIKKIQEAYEGIVPSDQMVDIVEKKFKSLAEAAGLSMDDIQGYLFRGNKDLREYVKDLEDDLQDAEDEVNKYNLVKDDSPLLVDQKELDKWEALAKIIKEVINYLSDFKKAKKDPKDAYVQDPLINKIKEQMKYMKDFQKGYDEFRKYMSDTSALEKESGIMKFRGQALGLSIDDQNKAAKNLSEWYSTTMADIFKRVQQKYHITGDLEYFLSQEIKDTTNRGKALKDFQALLQSMFDAQTDIKTDEAKKNLERALAKLKDEIKRSEEAKNFFKDILNLTGDETLSTNLALSVYGDPGSEIGERIRESISESLKKQGYSENDAIFKQLTDAAENMDFRDVMKNIDQVPENLQEVVKDAASTIEKYNTDIAKSYSKLLMKYNEMEQQRVNIENQADKDIADFREGLRLEIQGINENAAIQDKEAAIKAAKDRVDAAIDGVRRESELQMSRLSRDYRLFFSSVGVISDKAARQVAANQKKMLTEQFNAGQKTLAQYKRELREIEEQLKKYESNKGILVTYLTGGSDAVIDKLGEYSDSLLAIADASFNKKNGTWLMDEDDKAYIDKMGQLFGGKIFGVSGRANVFDKLLKQTEGNAEDMQKAIEGASEAIKEMESGMSQGIGWAGFWVSLFGGAIKSFDEIAQHSKNASGEVADGWNKVANVLMKIPTLGFSKNDDAWERFTSMNDRAMEGFEKFKSGNIIGALIDVVYSWAEMFNKSTKTIERQIKEQSDLLDDLKYQYDRLGVAIEDSFGSDYIYNYNKQMEVLQAQAEAYRKQAELEREKGKKADEDTAKGYEKSARDIEDQIADAKNQLAEFFSGTDLTSAAKDFANSWIEAYKQFGNTTDAMKEKFQDMVEEMITNSLAAKIMQEQLQPIFDEINRLAKEGGELSVDDVAAIASMAAATIPNMNDALTTLMTQLQAAGVNLRTQPGQFTGIARNIASASEESINGLAAGINTQNFYMQHIDATVTAILAHLTGGAVVTNEGAAGSVTNPYQEEMLAIPRTYLPQMSSDLANIFQILRQVTADTPIKKVAVRM